MTDQQKNQLIAEKCPGRFLQDEHDKWFIFNKPPFIHPCINGSIIEDLNAMAVAEEYLTNAQKHNYVTELFELYKTADGEADVTGVKPCIGWYPVHATSNQRADAFGKVMGLL